MKRKREPRGVNPLTGRRTCKACFGKPGIMGCTFPVDGRAKYCGGLLPLCACSRPAAVAANEAATSAIVGGKVRWCRAKILHVLAGAATQGVLDEVLGELVSEHSDLTERVVAALRESGWLPEKT
jgi:hypothetical protein